MRSRSPCPARGHAVAFATPFCSEHARGVMLDNMDRIRFVAEDGKPLIMRVRPAGAKAQPID